MLRYHKDVYTKPEDISKVDSLVNDFKGLGWGYSGHCLDNIKSRVIDSRALLLFIKGLELTASQVFEYYIAESRAIEKLCFRIPYISGLDIILVIGNDKNIITIYINSSEDNHETLKKELYQRA